MAQRQADARARTEARKVKTKAHRELAAKINDAASSAPAVAFAPTPPTAPANITGIKDERSVMTFRDGPDTSTGERQRRK